MLNGKITIRRLIALSATAVLATSGFGRAQTTAQTTAPATSPAARKSIYNLPMTREAHFSELGKQINIEFNELMHIMIDRAILNDDHRKALLPTVKPKLLRLRDDLRKLTADTGNSPFMLNVLKGTEQQTLTRLALLGDEETIQALQADAAGSDVAKAMSAECIFLKNRWTLADGNPAKESQIVSDLEKLCHAHPESVELSKFVWEQSGRTTPELRERMLDLGAGVLKSAAAEQFEGTRQRRAAAKILKDTIGKPFALRGQLPDGKAFTTADWKGKVILVDFWAVWCAPCVAELPEIKKLYDEYHDKGLEVLGVSNDFDLKQMLAFTDARQMPWPQLVDPDAMAKQTWNPITLAHGIDGIPRLIVIDRNGMLVSDNARSNYKDLVAKAIAQP